MIFLMMMGDLTVAPQIEHEFITHPRSFPPLYYTKLN